MVRQATQFARRAARAVNRRVRTRIATRALYAAAKRSRRGPRAAVVVAMPNAIHLAEAALRKLGGDLTRVCVLNGVSARESARIRGQFPDVEFIAIGYKLNHHLVIEPLVQTWDDPFWLVDHDCFVLDLEALRQAEQQSLGNAGAAFYGHRNSPTSFWKPQTFLMLLRPKMLREIAGRYGVRIAWPTQWARLSEAVKARLGQIGITADHLPETHKDYFDTLCLIACLAQADGVGWHAHRDYPGHFEPHPDAIHIGNTSNLLFSPTNHYAAFGAYFWRVATDSFTDPDLRGAYLRANADLPTAAEMRRALLADGVEPAVLEQLESVVRIT